MTVYEQNLNEKFNEGLNQGLDQGIQKTIEVYIPKLLEDACFSHLILHQFFD